MKRFILLVLCTCMLYGCGNSIGSFEDGTLDMKKLVTKINNETNEGVWDMNLLKENSSDSSYLEEFGLTSEDVINYGVFPSVIGIQPDMVAIFEVSDHMKDTIKQKIASHINTMKDDTKYLPQYKDIITSYKEAEIGNYYIVVIGDDADQVLQFITECA